MKRYLVTGATSGVGLEVARSLHQQGHAITVVGRSIDRLQNQFGRTLGFHPHLLDFETVEPLTVTQSIKDWSFDVPFDGIFHAAGSELVMPLRMTNDEQFVKAMTFAASTFAILRAAASLRTLTDGASVVIMSSVAAHRGTAGMAAYSAARAAAEAMARSAAIELAGRHIRVNCLAAGAFESPMHGRVVRRMASEAAIEAYRAKHPLGFGMVNEVRDAALFLLSDAARWTNGTVAVVDGGYLAA